MEDRLKKTLKKVKENEPIISTILGAIVIIIVGGLIFNYFKSNQKQKQAAQQARVSPSPNVIVEGGVKFITKEDKKIPQDLPATHTVSKGEYLWEIAKMYYNSGYNWTDIAEENNLVNPDQLAEGQELVIPQVAVKEIKKDQLAFHKEEVENPIEEAEYTVQKGDTLWDIAVRAYGDGYQWTEVAQANNLANPNHIEVSQKLQIPR